ncbi:MAG: hypothetical protein ACYCYF_04590 [Anaerolineae bacterium]
MLAPREQHMAGLGLSMRITLEWARELTAPEGESAPMPLSRLADLRRIAPRTLREHLARLEGLGLLTRVYAGQAGLSIRILAAPSDPDPARDPLDESLLPAASGPPVQPVSGLVRDSIDLLTRAGVYPQLARSLARKPWVTPDLIAAWVHELRHIRAVRVLAAVLVHTLQDPERCLPPPAPPAVAPRSGQDGERDAPAGSRPLSEQSFPGQAEHASSAGSRLAETPPERVQLSRSVEVSTHSAPSSMHVSPEPGALWECVHHALASRLPAEMDALWLRRARPLSLSDGVPIVAVPSNLGAEWLNLAGAPRCYDAICEAAGRRLLLRFVPARVRDCL